MPLSSQDSAARIPTYFLTTAGIPPEHQFPFWRKHASPFTCIEKADLASPGFQAHATGYDLGTLHIVSSEVDPVVFRHTLDHVGMMGFNHWTLNLLKSGTVFGRTENCELNASANGMFVKSFAIPFEGQTSRTSSLRIMLSRDYYADLAPGLDRMDHRPMSGPMADIFRNFLMNIEGNLGVLSIQEGTKIVEAFEAMLRAVLEPTPDHLDRAAAPITASKFHMIEQFVMKNLNVPDLGAESICSALGMSRRQLYYIFEPYGGVAKFIKNRRLVACWQLLADTDDDRLISTIAYDHGFTSSATFSRQFQAEFGFSPREARMAKLNNQLPAMPEKDGLSYWMRQFTGHNTRAAA